MSDKLAIEGFERVGEAIRAKDAEIEALRERLAEVERENTRLRAALAQSDLPCVYCTLPKEDWSKCQHGFPGCDRADDAMGCPELGASLRAEAAEAREKQLLEKIELQETALNDLCISLNEERAEIQRLREIINKGEVK